MDEYEVCETRDQSATVFSKRFDQHFHSLGGALRESRHIYIDKGLDRFSHKEELSIYEIGFGTGLNVALTMMHKDPAQKIVYETTEKYPLDIALVEDFSQHYDNSISSLLKEIHALSWDTNHHLSDFFSFRKSQVDFCSYFPKNKVDLLYFDAFSPQVQPECWSESVFKGLYEKMNDSGVLVTYCAKGDVKRRLKSIGFEVETLDGPPGKREMVRAIK